MIETANKIQFSQMTISKHKFHDCCICCRRWQLEFVQKSDLWRWRCRLVSICVNDRRLQSGVEKYFSWSSVDELIFPNLKYSWDSWHFWVFSSIFGHFQNKGKYVTLFEALPWLLKAKKLENTERCNSNCGEFENWKIWF